MIGSDVTQVVKNFALSPHETKNRVTLIFRNIRQQIFNENKRFHHMVVLVRCHNTDE